MRKKRNKFTRKNTKTKYRKRTRKKYTKKRNKRGGSADQWPPYVTDGALCYKQKPTMTLQWPERYVKIEGHSLNFYDANRAKLGSGSDDSLPEMGKKRGSSVPDVSGCTVSKGTEIFGIIQKRYLPKVILRRGGEHPVIVQMAFEEEARANKFHEILTDLVKNKHTATRKAERDESDEIHAPELQRIKLPDRAAAALTGREDPLSREEMNQLISDMMDEKIREEEDMLQADQPELPPASPTAGPPSGIEPDMPPPAEAPLAEAPLAEAPLAEPQAVLLTTSQEGKIRQMLGKISDIYLNTIVKDPNHDERGTHMFIEFLYKDIVYRIHLTIAEGKQTEIISRTLGRYSQEKSLYYRDRHVLSDEDAIKDPSEKGDGALFVAAVVLYMNKIYPDLIWYGGATDWWRRKENICCNINECGCDPPTELGGCIHKVGCEDGVEWGNACESRRQGEFKIDNGKFKLWAEALFRRNGIDNPDELLAEIKSPDEYLVF